VLLKAGRHKPIQGNKPLPNPRHSTSQLLGPAHSEFEVHVSGVFASRSTTAERKMSAINSMVNQGSNGWKAAQ
jgi:hypothetical protein